MLPAMLYEISGELELFPGRRKPAKLEQADAQNPASEEMRLIAPRSLSKRQDLSRNLIALAGLGPNKVVQVLTVANTDQRCGVIETFAKPTRACRPRRVWPLSNPW